MNCIVARERSRIEMTMAATVYELALSINSSYGEHIFPTQLNLHRQQMSCRANHCLPDGICIASFFSRASRAAMLELFSG
jgi:hypothetical protein